MCIIFSVLSAEHSVYQLVSQFIGRENKDMFRKAYRKSIQLPAGFYGYIVVDFDLRNKFVNKYRLRNFLCSFKEEKLAKSMKALTRKDMWVEEIK